MSEAIIFPHLGIELKHVGRAVSILEIGRASCRERV